MSWWRTFLVFSFVVSFSTPLYATNPSYHYARAILKILTQPGGVVREVTEEGAQAASKNWADDLTYVAQQLRGVRAPELRGLPPDVAATVRTQIDTPHKALLYIDGTDMGPELLAGWDLVIANYIRQAQKIKVPFKKSVSDELLSWASQEQGYVFLEKFYFDEIQKRLASVRGTIPDVHPMMKREEFRGTFQWLDEFFNSGRRSAWEDVRYVPEGEQAAASVDAFVVLKEELDPRVARFNTELDYIATWNRRLSRNSPGWPRYVSDVEELFRLVRNYSNILRKNRAVGFQMMNALGVVDDYLLAQIRYGDPLTRKLAMSSLMMENHLGGRGLSFGNICEILRVPDRDFRKYALDKMIQQGPVGRKDVKVSLEALLLRANRYFSEDPELRETTEVMAMLLTNQEEFFLEAMVVSQRLPLREQLAAMRALGWMDSPGGFEVMIGAFMKSEFRDLALGHPEILSAYIDGLGAMISGQHSSGVIYRVSAVRELLKVMITREENLLVRQEALRGFELLLKDIEDEGAQKLASTLLRESSGELSQPTLLDVISRSGGDKEGLLQVVKTSFSLPVKLRALTVLAKAKDREAATLLLELFDQVSGGEKLEIVQILLGNYGNKDHKVIIRKTFERILTLYDRADIDFDLFQVCGDFMVRSRLKLLAGDRLSYEMFSRYLSVKNRELQELLSVALEQVKAP